MATVQALPAKAGQTNVVASGSNGNNGFGGQTPLLKKPTLKDMDAVAQATLGLTCVSSGNTTAAVLHLKAAAALFNAQFSGAEDRKTTFLFAMAFEALGDLLSAAQKKTGEFSILEEILGHYETARALF